MKSKVQLSHLRELSRDKKSFERLKQLFNQLIEEKETAERDIQLLESVVRNDYDAIMITELDLETPGPKIVYVNDGFCKMTGYTREEVIGKTPRILQGPKTDRAVLDKLKKRLTEGQSFFGQAVNYRKDGSEFVNQWDIHPLINSEGKVTHWVSYQHDITKRKQAEKEFVNAHSEFDELREEAKRTVMDVDIEGNIVTANRSFRELIGFGKDELKQIKAWDLFPERYRDFFRSQFGSEKDSEKFSNKQFRTIIRHRSGVPIQVEGQTKVLNLNNRSLVRVDVKNISLQKRVMEVLQRRNRDYSAIFEKASEFTYQLVSNKGEYILNYISDEFSKVTGLSPKEVEKKGGLKSVVHSDDITKLEEHLRKICEGNSRTCEYRIRSTNGEYISVIDYGTLKRDEPENDTILIKGAVSIKSSASYTGPKSRSIH